MGEASNQEIYFNQWDPEFRATPIRTIARC
jgi:hypothetical protein